MKLRAGWHTRAVITLIALFAVIGVGGNVSAHAGLGAASPAPGSVVGGEITEIQLRYGSTVVDVDGSVTDPDGNVIESVWVQDGNLRITITLTTPLSIPGEYTVQHISTDVEDDDRVDTEYQFTYDPSAPAPQLEIIPDDDGGFPWIWVVVIGGVLVIGVLAWQLNQSMRRARQARATT